MIFREYFGKPNKEEQAKWIDGKLFITKTLSPNSKDKNKIINEIFLIMGYEISYIKDGQYLIDNEKTHIFLSWLRPYGNKTAKQQIDKEENISRELQFTPTLEMKNENSIIIGLDLNFLENSELDILNSFIIIQNISERINIMDFNNFNPPTKCCRLNFSNITKITNNKFEKFEDKTKKPNGEKKYFHFFGISLSKINLYKNEIDKIIFGEKKIIEKKKINFKEESEKIILNDFLIEENNKKFIDINGKVYARNSKNVSDLRKYVKEKLNKKCEFCKDDLFLKEDGDPYFEAHHIKFLFFNGEDKKENMIALCPNCHKKAHFSIGRKKMEEDFLLIAKNRENF